MRLTVSVMVLCSALLGACGGSQSSQSGHDDHGHGGAEHADEPQGPNGGRLLTEGDLTIEIRLVDQPGKLPRYVAWVTRAGKPLTTGVERLAVRTERLGGESEIFDLAPSDGAFAANIGVREPHSFAVKVSARVAGRDYSWSFDSIEGRVTIDAPTAAEAGITTAKLAGGVILETVEVPGVVRAREAASAKVIARFPGVVKSVRVRPGDRVAAGAVLATIESNASLSTYSLTAPISGTVIRHDALVGAAVSDMPLFELANTDTLQVDLRVFGKMAQSVRAGSPVRVQRLTDERVVEAQINRLLPDVDVATQSIIAQATIKNNDGLWRPGAAVQAEVELSRVAVERAVPIEALQTWREMDVVFIKVGDAYEVRPVKIGRRDRRSAEILDGVNVGDLVVVGQSYLIKADIEKSGATHDH
ncbi:MAG: HlyD family efflux transporter periplasmic adaptor subunit [Sinobacteraceae bacterium]|nr:HlyD family efflux transporter periplasmic adaptor subunit [Nevskiaceae bacterium]